MTKLRVAQFRGGRQVVDQALCGVAHGAGPLAIATRTSVAHVISHDENDVRSFVISHERRVSRAPCVTKQMPKCLRLRQSLESKGKATAG